MSGRWWLGMLRQRISRSAPGQKAVKTAHKQHAGGCTPVAKCHGEAAGRDDGKYARPWSFSVHGRQHSQLVGERGGLSVMKLRVMTAHGFAATPQTYLRYMDSDDPATSDSR